MQSITLEQTKKKIDNFNNQTLYNFIKRRECQHEPSNILKYAYDVVKERLAKEHAMVWRGKRPRQEPLQDIIDRGNEF